MFVFQFGELVERSELFEALPRDYDQTDDASRGGHDRLQDHTDELATQHLRHAAEVAFRLQQDKGFGRLTIGASDEVNAAIEPLLHPYLRERLVGRIGVGAGASEPEVRAAAMTVEREVERAKEAAFVARLRDGVGSGSKAVAGLVPTLGALNERRVATLLVSEGYAESGWRCGCGALAAKGPQCPVDGQAMEHVDDVLNDAVDVALGQGCHVEVCVGNADLDVLGRVGALLRY
jgi:peptide subunit release factor 1 (eRF1)